MQADIAHNILIQCPVQVASNASMWQRNRNYGATMATSCDAALAFAATVLLAASCARRVDAPVAPLVADGPAVAADEAPAATHDAPAVPDDPPTEAETPAARPYDPLAVPPDIEIRPADYTVRDAKRRREIPVRVYLPPASTAAPVVLFSHGLGGSRKGCTYLGTHWAARGYAAVFLQHPGSDEAVWKDAPPRARRATLERAASTRNFLLRMGDVPAVLDQLAAWNERESNPLRGRLDVTRVGMSGHSFGAVTTQAVSGQAFGGRTPRPDPRIRAALLFSPSIPKRGGPAAAFGGVRIPWMLMTGTRDESAIGRTDVAARRAVYPALRCEKYELVLHDAEHSAFTDRALPGEAQKRNPNHHRVILALSTAFWDAALRDSDPARAWLRGDGPRSILQPRDEWQFDLPPRTSARRARTSPPALGPGDHTVRLTVGGIERAYLVHVPPRSTARAPLPVVLMLHGGGGKSGAAARETGWSAKADAEGFLAVYPDALPRDRSRPGRFVGNPRLWNDASGRFHDDANAVDDVGYLAAVLDDLAAKLDVDARRVFVTGFSNGASMTFRLGAELSRRVAAIAPVAGACWLKAITLRRPVPMCYITGTEDPLNPIAGGVPKTARGGLQLGAGKRKPPVRDSILAWARANGCSTEPSRVSEKGGVRTEVYGPGRGGARVIYIAVERLGHTWAGGKSLLPEFMVGKTTDRISATDVIWQFFREHSMGAAQDPK